MNKEMAMELVDKAEVYEEVKKQFNKYHIDFADECHSEESFGKMVSDSIKNVKPKKYYSDCGEYWRNVCDMYAKQREKGLATYGQTLEDNTDLGVIERITMAQEEMIDMLVYMEHIKDWLVKNGRV